MKLDIVYSIYKQANMSDLSNDELRSRIKSYERILVKRESNLKTIDTEQLIRKCCTDIKSQNVSSLLKSLHKTKGHKDILVGVPICCFYTNNLSIENRVMVINEKLYLLYRYEERVQCESDSSYDSDEVEEGDSSNETIVTKQKNISYLTKTDLIALLTVLEKRAK